MVKLKHSDFLSINRSSFNGRWGRMKDSKVIKTDDGLAVTIPAEVAERLQLTAGSQVELELTADNKLALTRAEEPIKKMSDSEFWAAVAYAKNKYAKTLQMLAESDRQWWVWRCKLKQVIDNEVGNSACLVIFLLQQTSMAPKYFGTLSGLAPATTTRH